MYALHVVMNATNMLTTLTAAENVLKHAKNVLMPGKFNN
jgi:hypothetical protein